MKNFPDPKLTEISRQLRDTPFEPDQILEHAAEALTITKGVRQFPENKKQPGAPREYFVVLFVAQKERVIGRTKSLTAACRFADMARLRFYRYRQRHAVEPRDDELNFTVAQAKTDLQFEHNAVAILDEIEAHFREKGFWKDAPVKETRNNTSRSERWTISKMLREVQAEVEVLKEQVSGLMLLAQLQPESFKQSEVILLPESRELIEQVRTREIELLKGRAKLESLAPQFSTDLNPITELIP